MGRMTPEQELEKLDKDMLANVAKRKRLRAALKEKEKKEKTERWIRFGKALEKCLGRTVDVSDVDAVVRRLEEGETLERELENAEESAEITDVIRWIGIGRAVEGVFQKKVEGDPLKEFERIIKHNREVFEKAMKFPEDESDIDDWFETSRNRFGWFE